MVRCTVIIVLVLVTVGCVKLEEDCVSKGNCNRTENQTDTENDSLTPYIQEITAKPIEKPKALNMYIEDQVATGVHPAEITAVPAAEAKGRALDFNVDDHSNGLTNSSGIKDLSDVSMDDDELEEPIKNAKILAPKSIEKNSTLGICEKGGLTYENGEKLEVGCDSICTCSHGKMDCVDRCTGPFIRKGKKIDDPFCSEKAADDHCCSVLQCTSDTETEPLELCTYMNKTYHRGDVIQEGCMEVCSCEAGGHLACKPRCNAIKKTSDKCLEIPDMNDPCCKTVICDVTLKDNKLISARYTNTTTIKLEFEGKIEMNQTLPLIDISDDKNNWKTFTPLPGGYLSGLSDPNYKFAKIENTDDIIEIQSFDETKKPTKDKLKGTKFCDFKGMEYKLGEEFSDACEQFCVCKETGVKCIKMECPTYFGTDVLDPNCIEWDTVPSNFTPTPPLCCPEKLRCKNNGSCEYEGETYQNWNQIPTNITGCKKRCYCEMGKVECQNICPPVTAHPPANIECPAHQAVLGPLPGDDCCVYWTCPEKDDINSTEPIKTEEIISQNKTDSPFVLPFVPTKSPSKTLGPLLVYANGDNKTVENDLNLQTNSQSTKKPIVLLQENPYFEKNKKTNNDVPYLGPFNPAFKPPQKPKDKNNKPNKTTFVTAPTISNDNYIPENNYADLPNKVPNDHIHIHGKGDPHEFLHLLNQHPEIANYPPGSVLEIHNIPQRPEYNPNAIDPNILNPNVIQANAENVNGLPPNIINQNILNRNAINPNNLHPNRLNPNSNKHIPLPAGISLEQILQEIHKGGQSNAVVPYSQYPTNDGQIFLPPPPNRPLFNGRPQQNTSGLTHPGIFSNGFSNIPGYPQPQDDINVHILEALDAHTIRLAFTVPPVIVGLHGRVEVRYTNKDDEDQNTWELQVFAPPNDLIATPQLEFDLVDLRAETEYKIKITVTLRDLHNTPTSRVYTIKTLKEIQTSALPPSIPIDPELIITNINATWVNVAWRKFTEYELQFIDGVQLRYKEIDGKIYAATPLIHRAVTSYTLENLKPNNKYEIGIFFIPFPGQQTELHAEHMLHFTTANEVDTYGFNVSLEISLIKPTNVEISWSGVPYPEDKYVNIYRAIYQSDSGKGDSSTFKIAKRDLPPKTTITDLKPGTRYRLWLEVYLTNGKIKTSNVQDFITKPRPAPTLGASSKQDKLSGEFPEERSDYYGPLVIVAILAAIAILSTLVLLLILVKRQNQNKACITPPPRVSQSAYDNPTYKVEIQQETMDL